MTWEGACWWSALSVDYRGRGPERPGRRRAALKCSTGANRVGVVFVHGIGTQPACETFLDWSTAIVNVLADWRTDRGLGLDPVLRCDYDLTGARAWRKRSVAVLALWRWIATLGAAIPILATTVVALLGSWPGSGLSGGRLRPWSRHAQ